MNAAQHPAVGRIAARLADEVATRLHMDIGRVGVEANLVTELGMSSLDLLNLLAWVEEEFAVRIPDSQLGELCSIDRVAGTIHVLRNQAGAEES